ncbi:MAG: hypothetical protein IIW17_00310 [Clostridia bacterium]|nr:hypothetical protein [Clostridia bacterium]
MQVFENQGKPACMQYDGTLQLGGIDYAFVYGDHRIVFVKVGLGGDCFGEEDKYLFMARMLQNTYGCSVIVAANPCDGKSHVDADGHAIARFIAENGVCDPQLYLFGNSGGCVKGLALATRTTFVRAVLVNMPLMIDFHKTKRYIAALSQTEILAVYGARDPSAPYVPFLEGRFANLRVRIVAGADHNFHGMTHEFIDLSRDLMQKPYA